MKRLALLLALTGCNQVFSLDDTRLVDAGHIFVDAPADAPPMCAAAPVAPNFDQEFHQAVYADQSCKNYQTSAVGLALATCIDTDYKIGVYEGLVGSLNGMTAARGDIAADGAIYGLALTPEGNEVYVARYNVARGVGVIFHYRRDATGMWHFIDEPAITYLMGQHVSTVTRGPRRHMFVLEDNTQIREWKSDDTGAWTQARLYTAASLGTSYIFSMDMSSDGMRLFMYAEDPVTYRQGVFYTYRDTIDDLFGPPVVIASAPNAQDIFQTADCGRMYFSGVGAVFYVREL